MTTWTRRALGATLLLAAPALLALTGIRQERLQFAEGATGAKIEGRLQADEGVDDPVHSRAGQQIPVALAAAAPRPFDRELELLGVTFRVVSPNRAAGNSVEITTAGLTVDNSPWKQEIEGVVTGAEVGDIDADQSPEIYVYVTGTGQEAHGSLVAYSANRKKSLSAIYLPELSAHPGATEGYRGHDEMAVVEGILARRFPIFGADGRPTGRMRQLQYKLAPGEAGWTLRLDRMIEF